MQQDGKIRFADANHGLFLFDTKEQFISAYRVIYHQYESQNNSQNTYHFYSVQLLKEDKQNKIKDSQTLSGKWRSILYGQKYKD